MNKQMVGIDISKEKLDFCALNRAEVKVIQRGELDNEAKAIKKWLKQFDPNELEFALEHTGHYGALLIQLLDEKDFSFFVLNPLELKRSLGIQRGKTDQKDAYRIAEYAITRAYKLTYFRLATEKLTKLKALLTARERYVKMSVQLQNSLKANEILNQSVDCKFLIRKERSLLKAIKKSIKLIEQEIKKIISSEEQIKKNYDQIKSVIGVGPIIAAKCIAATENFTKFTDARKFSCHCGLAPFPHESGSSVRGKTKTHFLRDRSLKAILTKGAVTAVQHDPELKAYYQRKLKEGKNTFSVLNAVANKLVLRIFGVVKRDKPYEKRAA